MSYRGQQSYGYGTIRRAQRLHARRSNRAKWIDEGLRVPLAKSPEQWMKQQTVLTSQKGYAKKGVIPQASVGVLPFKAS